ncbi:hypothetical protein [Pulveribacter sp.]|uniref:hypothetical protein n=1 Tax=Pulveribacter sp. TaxID=2678893 RepID=UPI0028A0547C|nr:hypothetical protein [Pulveribacter sp.]
MSDAAAAQPPLALAILRELAQPGLQDGLALPALSKRLGLGASAVLRQLSALGDAPLGGGQRGPGWVYVWQDQGRWRAALTAEGRAWCAQALPPWLPTA